MIDSIYTFPPEIFLTPHYPAGTEAVSMVLRGSEIDNYVYGITRLLQRHTLAYGLDAYRFEQSLHRLGHLGISFIDVERIMSSINNNHYRLPVTIRALPEGYKFSGNKYPLVIMESTDPQFPEAIELARYALKDLPSYFRHFRSVAKTYGYFKSAAERTCAPNKVEQTLSEVAFYHSGEDSGDITTWPLIDVFTDFFAGFNDRAREEYYLNYDITAKFPDEMYGAIEISHNSAEERLKYLNFLKERVNGPTEVHYTFTGQYPTLAELREVKKILEQNKNLLMVFFSGSNERFDSLIAKAVTVFDVEKNEKDYYVIKNDIKVGFTETNNPINLSAGIDYLLAKRVSLQSACFRLYKTRNMGRTHASGTWRYNGFKVNGEWIKAPVPPMESNALKQLPTSNLAVIFDEDQKHLCAVDTQKMMPGESYVDLLQTVCENGSLSQDYVPWMRKKPLRTQADLLKDENEEDLIFGTPEIMAEEMANG